MKATGTGKGPMNKPHVLYNEHTTKFYGMTVSIPCAGVHRNHLADCLCTDGTDFSFQRLNHKPPERIHGAVHFSRIVKTGSTIIGGKKKIPRSAL